MASPDVRREDAYVFDGMSRFFFNPVLPDPQYDKLPILPEVDDAWFRDELTRTALQSGGFEKVRGRVAKVTGAMVEFGLAKLPVVSTLGGTYVEELLLEKTEIGSRYFQDNAIALVDYYARTTVGRADISGGHIDLSRFKDTMLSRDILDKMPKELRDVYVPATQGLLAQLTQHGLDKLADAVKKNTDDVVNVRGEVAAIGNDVKALAKRQILMRADLRQYKNMFAKLQKSHVELAQARLPRERDIHLAEIASTAQQLAGITDGLYKLASIGGLKKIGPWLGRTQVAFSMVAGVAGKLALHDYVGAANSFVGGVAGLFGGPPDTFRQDVMDGINAIRSDLAVQRTLLLEVLFDTKTISAQELTTAHMVSLQSELNEKWFRAINEKIESVAILVADSKLADFGFCRSWADANVTTGRDGELAPARRCDEAFIGLTSALNSANGDFSKLPAYLHAIQTSSLGQQVSSKGGTPAAAATTLLGVQVVYREMVRGCWNVDSCRTAVEEELPVEYRAHANALISAPLLDAQAVARVAEGARARFDLFVLCRDTTTAARLLPALVAAPPYNNKSRPPTAGAIEQQCKERNWNDSLGASLDSTARLLQLVLVQQRLLAGTYLAPHVASALTRGEASGGIVPLTLRPRGNCVKQKPAEKIEAAVKSCEASREGKDCSAFRNLATENVLEEAMLAKLQTVIALESVRLCSNGKTSMVCLMDLNRMFGANVGFEYVVPKLRRRIAMGLFSFDTTSTNTGIYAIAYADPLSCEGMWEFVASGGILHHKPIQETQYVASTGWSLNHGVVSREGVGVCNLGDATVSEWDLAVHEETDTKCEMTTFALPGPEILSTGRRAATDSERVALGALVSIEDRRGFLEIDARGHETLNMKRAAFERRQQRLLVSALRHATEPLAPGSLPPRTEGCHCGAGTPTDGSVILVVALLGYRRRRRLPNADRLRSVTPTSCSASRARVGSRARQ